MPKIGELFIDISANNSKLRANLAEASSLIRDWSLLITGLTSGINNAFQTIVRVGVKGVIVATSAMVGTFALAAKSGADFEDSMIRAFTFVQESSKATQGDFMALTETARELGRETLFSAIQAADGMQILAKAGFDTREIIDSIKPTMDLAIVGNMELADAAQISASILRGFGMNTADAGRVADVLAVGASSAATTIDELGTAMSYIAPVASGLGLNVEQTTAALGVLADRGIRGSMAGTTLRRALTQLVAPTGRAKKILDKLNLSFKDSQGNVKPLVTVIQELNDSGLSAAQAMEVFGLRAGPGMIALMQAGSGAVKEMQERLEGASGAADRMSQKFRTSVKGRTRDLIASIVDLGLAFSEEFKGPLADTIFAIRNYIVEIVEMGNRTNLFSKIIKGVQKGLEPLRKYIKENAKAFKDFLANLKTGDIAKTFDNIGKKVQEFIEFLKDDTVIKTVQTLWQMIEGLWGGLMKVRDAVMYVWNLIPEQSKPAVAAVGILTAAFVHLFGGILSVVIFMISMKAIIGALAAQMTGVVAANMAIVANTSLWKIALVGIGAVVQTILVVILAIAAAIVAINLFKLISEMKTWGALWDWIGAKVDEMIAKMQGLIAHVKLYKATLFGGSGADEADALVAARNAEVGAKRRGDTAWENVMKAAAEDVQAQKDFMNKSVGDSIKDAADTIGIGKLGKMLTDKVSSSFNTGDLGLREMGPMPTGAKKSQELIDNISPVSYAGFLTAAMDDINKTKYKNAISPEESNKIMMGDHSSEIQEAFKNNFQKQEDNNKVIMDILSKHTAQLVSDSTRLQGLLQVNIKPLTNRVNVSPLNAGMPGVGK